MKTVNPLLSRLLGKAMKPRNPVLAALKDRRGGAGSHGKARGAIRRAEKMAVARVISDFEEGDDHA